LALLENLVKVIEIFWSLNWSNFNSCR